ncbi:uncharacterized protein [Littorina saxatilis]|uniref:Uncharacterized protein n=1 Tax=Littorina saxatilis TaxID=31220 RepID=A0AAN9FWK4_9CAEN
MVAAELRIVLSFSLIVCATAATLPGQMTSSAVNADDKGTSQELELDDLSLPPEVITEALFSQVDLIQDQLEICEEMVRNSLNGDTSVESVNLDEQNNTTTTATTNNSLAQDTSQEIAQLAVKHFGKDSDDDDDDDVENDDDNDDDRDDDDYDDDDDDDVDAIDDDDDDDDDGDDVDANDDDDDVDDHVEETKDRLDSEETSGEVSIFPAEPQENNDIIKRRRKRSVSLEQAMMVTSEEGSKKGQFEDLHNVQVTLRQGRLQRLPVDPAGTIGIGSKDGSVEREHHTDDDLLLMSGPATFSLQDDSRGTTHVGGEGLNKILGMAQKNLSKKPSLESVMKMAKELLGSLKSSNAGERGNVASFDQSHRSSGKTPNVDSVLQLVERLMGSSKAPRQEEASHIKMYDPETEDIFSLSDLPSKLQRQRRKRSVEENLKPERYVPLIGQLVDRLKYLKHSLVVCHALLPPGYPMGNF